MNNGVLAAASVLIVATTAVTGSSAASANDDPASQVSFYDARGDVVRGHDIRRVQVDNEDDQITIKLWHRDLQKARQYSFRLYLDTESSTSTPEVKVYGAFPNADYAACLTTSWGTGATSGCDPEDQATQCRVDFGVQWDRDVTRFDFKRTARCLAGAAGLGVNVSIRQYFPGETRWDFARARHVWYPSVPRDTE